MNAPKPFPYIPEGPQPIVRELPPGVPFPVEALGPLRAVTEAVQGMTQAPVAIPAASALAIASLAVQGFADVETLGGARPVSLYLLTIAQSGERKSSCDTPLMAGLREHEKAEAQVYDAAFKKWRRDKEAFDEKKKAAIRAMGGKSGKSQIEGQADLVALGEEPVGPILPYRTASEPTLEGLFRSFSEGQPSLGLFSDEAGQFLGGFGMSADNRMKTLGGLNSLWDGKEIDRTRAGDGVSRLHGRRMSQHLMAQPVVMYDFLSDPLASGIGFLPRCLICEPPSHIGTRFSTNVTRDAEPLEIFKERLQIILRRSMPTWEDGRSLKTRRLPLAPAALQLVTRFSDRLEAEQAPGGQFSLITGTASKTAEQAARIAAVLSLWADLEAPEVGADAMANGITLAQFYLGEAARLAGAATVSQEVAGAETLRKWLVETWSHRNIIPSEILQFGPNKMREGPKIKKATDLLESYGWLVPLDEGTIVRGAARKRSWQIVRGAGCCSLT